MDLPGFDIHRELARGDTSRVHLATKRATGRLVALKVVPEGDEAPLRLRQAGCAVGLRHAHIVYTYAVGQHGSVLFVEMEPLLGGDLESRLSQGLSMAQVVRVFDELAGALDHAHSQGCVHGDVTPRNILFRSGPAAPAVLADFDRAWWAGTHCGALVGTVGYMSQEQAAGAVPDGRADLYSLGVVLRRMLTGAGPPGVGAPAPPLPRRFAAFQDFFDKLLAAEPAERYSTGAEAAAALAAIPIDGLTPGRPVRLDVVSSTEIEVVSERFDGLSAPTREERQRVARRRVRRWVAGAAAVTLAVATAGAVALTRPEAASTLLALTRFSELGQASEAWREAEALRRDPNQSLAAVVAAYRRVLAQSPAHEGAMQSIAAAATTWKADIDQALVEDDLALAEAKLAESLNVFPQDAELSILFERLSERRRVDAVLIGARALLATQSLSHEASATAAIQAYQEVLRRVPENAEARARLDELAAHYAALAERAVTDGDITDAMNKLGRAATANPDYPQLAPVRTLINQAATLQSEIDEMLAKAGAFREASALVDPPAANAAEIYHRVLATDPDNAIARQGLSEIAEQVLAQFDGLLGAQDLAAAERLMDQAAAVGLGDTAVNAMRTRHDAEVVRLATVAQLLTEAEALFLDGYLTEPVDGNAVAALREAARLDPGNERAAALLTRIAHRLARVASEAWDVGMRADARHYLDLALTVTPGVADWRRRRDSWDEGPSDAG